MRATIPPISLNFLCPSLPQVQQLLHAISLTAVDRANWRTTTWYQSKFGEAVTQCPNPQATQQ